jgi:DNA-binding NarL/FixJ family response regulator
MFQSDKQLSSRELDIVKLAATGMCDKEIASHLGVTLATVRTYWERLRVKTGSRSRTHAVCLALFGDRMPPSIDISNAQTQNI